MNLRRVRFPNGPAWLGLLLLFTRSMFGQSIQTLDLKPFVGFSPFDAIGATWLPQRGLQVIDGTPFQIDGVIIMYGDYQTQRTRPGKTNVNGILVGRQFECLHLFAGAQAVTAEGTPLARIHFQYADGSTESLEVVYGPHVRNWFAPWHQAETPPPDPKAREVWRALFSAAATTDKYLRMYHVVLTNPAPTRLVRTLSIESLKKPSGLMIAGMSVGPTSAESQPDTVPALKSPFPDLRPRSGEKVSGNGSVKRMNGEPLAGARVRVMKVRTFTENYNQGTEKDEAVGLEAVTDKDGNFTMPPLRDDRVYNLLVFADGFETAPFGGADVRSDPIELRLKPLNSAATGFAAYGRVIGPEGRPVASVLIEPEGVDTGTSMSWGGTAGFQEQNFSDSKGEFVLRRSDPFARVQVRIKVPGLAPEMAWLPASLELQTIRLGVGATIRGRLVSGETPVVDAGVGLVGVDRSSEVFAGHFETRTDINGVFVFTNLPAGKPWYVHGMIASLQERGALPPQMLAGVADGATQDLGDLKLQSALRLAGTVKTRSGEPLPAGVKIRVGSDKAWDSLVAPVDETGSFEIKGLYSGTLTLSLEPRIFKLSGRNRSLDLFNGWRMIGVLEGDKTDLLVIIEKGEYDYNSSSTGNGQLPMADRPENHPLYGAEKSGAPAIVLAGRVLDDKTGQALPGYRVVPGYKPPVNAGFPAAPKPILKTVLEPFSKKTTPWNEQPFWMHRRTETNANADFAVEFVALSSTPMLRFEADGYLPFETEPYAISTSNLVIRLKPGTGPNGVVLLPDGKPAEGATVVFAIGREQFSLKDKSFSTYGSAKNSQTTGKEGKFSFPMRANGQRLFVTHDAGWAEVSVERSTENLKLRLQPWAVLTGTLVDANGQPKAGVELAVTMQHDWQRGEPLVNLQGRVTTDAQGGFQFQNIPPRRLEVQRMIPFGPAPSRGWSYNMQTWLIAQPGTNNLGNVTYDQPPPAPMFEQIKKSIGL